VADEEGGFRGREVRGGDDEVAFVLAVRGVEDDEEFAVRCGGLTVRDWLALEEVESRLPNASTASGMLSKLISPFVSAMTVSTCEDEPGEQMVWAFGSGLLEVRWAYGGQEFKAVARAFELYGHRK